MGMGLGRALMTLKIANSSRRSVAQAELIFTSRWRSAAALDLAMHPTVSTIRDLRIPHFIALYSEESTLAILLKPRS